jgi:nucleoside-triphosphatase THEP1
MSIFQKAVKRESKLRMAIMGPSGSGKTMTALKIAREFGGRVAVVDTENNSATKYADVFDFDTIAMEAPYHPDRFVEFIDAAVAGGYTTLIIDTLSHAWMGSGGLLELVDEIAKTMKTSNTFAAWKTATPIQQRMVEAIMSAKIHVIVTLRTKTKYVVEEVERNGRTVNVPRKVGMEAIQRDGIEYEFDVIFDMTVENVAIVSKTRCASLAGRAFDKPGADVAATLIEWLSGEPPRTEADIMRDVIDATDVDGFVVHAFALSWVKPWFESAQRLRDWFDFVFVDDGRDAVDVFNEVDTTAIVDILRKYANERADGVLVKNAAPNARKRAVAYMADDAADDATDDATDDGPTSRPIPDGFPAYRILKQCGYVTMSSIPNDVDQLTEIPGIGPATAKAIVELLS